MRTSEDADAARNRETELKANPDLLQAIIDASTDMIQVFEAVRDASGEIVDFRWVLNNHTSERLYGRIEGESLLQRNPGVVETGIFDAFKRVTETGVPEQAERHYVHEQFNGWFYQSVVKLGDGVATTTKDITEWKRSQAEVLRLQDEVAQARLRESDQQLQRALAELQHRVRNTLAVVRSIVRRTVENSETVEDLAMHLEGRLDAFARMQAHVVRNPHRGVHLASLIADELVAHRAIEGERATIEGPDVALRPEAAEKIALAVHELATNAVKYGALDARGGHIGVSWRIEGSDEDRMLVFDWNEHVPGGGVTPPTRRGFGAELFERTLVYELDADTRLDFTPFGLRCTVRAPLSNLV